MSILASWLIIAHLVTGGILVRPIKEIECKRVDAALKAGATVMATPSGGKPIEIAAVVCVEPAKADGMMRDVWRGV
jgi:hypothetical protein